MKLLLERYLPAEVVEGLNKEEVWQVPYFGASVSPKYFPALQISGKPICEAEDGPMRIRCTCIIERCPPSAPARFAKEGFCDIGSIEGKFLLADAHLNQFLRIWNYAPSEKQQEGWALHRITLTFD